jgi:putative ABC transport system permease protein
VVLISKDFVPLIAIGFLVAVPAGYYAINKWLQNFPYRISVGWWMFGAAGLLVMFVSLLTMSYLSLKAALANPVKSLRTE